MSIGPTSLTGRLTFPQVSPVLAWTGAAGTVKNPDAVAPNIDHSVVVVVATAGRSGAVVDELAQAAAVSATPHHHLKHKSSAVCLNIYLRLPKALKIRVWVRCRAALLACADAIVVHPCVIT